MRYGKLYRLGQLMKWLMVWKFDHEGLVFSQ